MIGTQSITKSIKRSKLTVSSWFLLISVALLPFDSYLGENGLSFLVLGSQILFVALRAMEYLLNADKRKFGVISVVGIYIFYSIIQIIRSFFYIGLTYNNALVLSMMCYYAAFLVRPISIREMHIMSNISIFQVLFFIIICIRHVQVYSGNIYMGISDIVDPNYLVTNCVVMIGLFLFKIQTTKKKSQKVGLIALLIAFTICVMLIGSRGGLFTFGFIVVVYILTQVKRPMKTFIVLIVFGSIIMGLFFALAPKYITERFSIAHMLQDGGSGRLMIWTNFLTYYKNQNLLVWLFGVGRDISPIIHLQEFGHTYYPHNLYVKTLLESGLIGLLLLILVLLHILKKSFKNKNGVLIAIICAFMFGAMFLDMDNMRVFWLILALGNAPTGKKRLRIWKNVIMLRVTGQRGDK